MPSLPPVASVSESGLTDCHPAAPAWPAIGAVTGCHVFVDHSRTPPLWLTAVMNRPSGVKRAESWSTPLPGRWVTGSWVATSTMSIPTPVVITSDRPSGLSSTSVLMKLGQ